MPATVDLTTGTQKATLIVHIVLSLLAILAVSLRIVARRKRQLQLQVDDYLIVIALVCSESALPGF